MNLSDLKMMRTELMEKFFTKHPQYRQDPTIPAILSGSIKLSRRMTVTLGNANFKRHEIKLNVRLHTKHPEQLNTTFAHELAHLVAYRIFTDSGHGPYWKHVMRVFGYTPERCHHLDVSDVKRRRPHVAVAYCGCPGEKNEHRLKAVKVRNMKMGYAYTCRRCSMKLKDLTMLEEA